MVARSGHRPQWRRRHECASLVLVLAVASFASPTAAGLIALSDQAALAGNWGLAVFAQCEGTQYYDIVVVDPLSGPDVEVRACNSLTLSSSVSGDAQLEAGTSIRLHNGFSVGNGASASFHIVPVLASPFAWVEDVTPVSENEYITSFWLRLDDYSFSEPGYLIPFASYTSTGLNPFFLVILRNDALEQNRLVAVACLDGGSCPDSLGFETALNAGWNSIRTHWKAGPGNGFLRISVNGSPFVPPTPALGALDNDTLLVETVRLGLVAGAPGPATGAFRLDEFASWE